MSISLHFLCEPHLPPARGRIIVVNPNGCGLWVRGGALEIGSRVQIEGLPVQRNVIARVMNSILLGEYEQSSFFGLALDEPGNVWGIEKPPEDWQL